MEALPFLILDLEARNVSEIPFLALRIVMS